MVATYHLNNCDPEDLGDTLAKCFRSFNITPPADAFSQIATFGQLCDTVISHIDRPDLPGCTTQQAFYKIRKAIIDITGASQTAIHPDTRLEDLIPSKQRRQTLKKIHARLGYKLIQRTWPLQLNFRIPTVGLLAKKAVLEHYQKSRRFPSTISHSELATTIRDLFIQETGLPPEALTREATFN